MKLWTNSIFAAAVFGTLVACSSAPKPETAPAKAPEADTTAAVLPKKDTLVTLKDRYSYALGMDMGRAIKNVDADIDKKLFLKSLRDQIEGNPLLLSDSQAEKALQELVLQMRVEQERKAAAAAKAALDSQKVFFENNKKVEGVIATPSGLQYKYIVKSADSTAKSPKLTDKVRVHYAGALLDGTEFDSSIKRGEPLEFPVNAVIQGWQELLTLMKVGEKVEAWIPSELGYGADGAAPVIPANALLVFQVELLDILSENPAADLAANDSSAKAKVDSVETKTVDPKQAKADSIAAVKAAKKAEQDSLAAPKKAKQDSLAAAKKAKADSIAAVKKAQADSIAAVKAAKKAEQDSLAAAKKAKQDSIAAAKKAKADSIAAVKKAKADSIAAVKAAKKAEQDSIRAAKKAEQDSLKAVRKAEQKAKQDSVKAARKAKQDSIAAVKAAKKVGKEVLKAVGK